nr:MAG: hypothetical protein [Bacteriophage sp.]
MILPVSAGKVKRTLCKGCTAQQSDPCPPPRRGESKPEGADTMTALDRKLNQIAAHGISPRKNRPTENRQQKRGKRGAGRVYLFFRVKFSGGWNHPPPVLLSSGGWNPSRAILSRVAFTIYPATLSPAWAAAVFKSSSISFGILIDFVANFDK